MGTLGTMDISKWCNAVYMLFTTGKTSHFILMYRLNSFTLQMVEHYLALHMPSSPKIKANSLHPHSNWPPIWQHWVSHEKWEKEGGRGRMAWCFWTYLTAENLAGLSLNINKAHMALLFCRRSLMEGAAAPRLRQAVPGPDMLQGVYILMPLLVFQNMLPSHSGWAPTRFSKRGGAYHFELLLWRSIAIVPQCAICIVPWPLKPLKCCLFPSLRFDFFFPPTPLHYYFFSFDSIFVYNDINRLQQNWISQLVKKKGVD